jgi:hypothetical protein
MVDSIVASTFQDGICLSCKTLPKEQAPCLKPVFRSGRNRPGEGGLNYAPVSSGFPQTVQSEIADNRTRNQRRHLPAGKARDRLCGSRFGPRTSGTLDEAAAFSLRKECD